MGTTFLTVLGTGPYSECEYYIGKDGEDCYCSATHLVQEAILEIYKNTRQDVTFDRVVCLLTGKAREKNWDTSTPKDGVATDGLKTRLERLCPDARVEEKSIPLGKDEETIHQVFEGMFESIEQDDKLYIDVTHGFRSMPMLFFPVISYARALKNITVKAIFYGAFEARNEENNKAPILDLVPYDEIMRWSFASETFVNYGVSKPIAQLLKERQTAQRGGLRNETSIASHINQLSSRIQTVRGRGDDKNGIGAAGLKLNKNINEWIKNSEYPLLTPLLENIRKAAEPFNSDDNVETGLATIKWCIDKNMVQQGFTALEETIISYVCAEYGYRNNCNKFFRGAVGGAIEAKQKKLRGSDAEDARFEPRGVTEEEAAVCMKIYEEMDKELCNLTNLVKENRNDMNHFGMRKQTKSDKVLTKDLNDCYERLLSYIRGNRPETQAE